MAQEGVDLLCRHPDRLRVQDTRTDNEMQD